MGYRSNDKSSWEELDRRDTQDLNGNYITRTYDCQSGRDKFFRYVRLRQAGKNRDGKDDLVLCGTEFLGTLRTDGKAAVVQMRLLREEGEHRKKGCFDLRDDRLFCEIICHLAEECGGDVHVKGVVNITASSNDAINATKSQTADGMIGG